MATARNEEEKAALVKFQETTKYTDLSDGVLMRYLRARDLDPKRAEEAITMAIEWKLNHLEKPYLGYWKPPEEFEARFKVYFTGLDERDRVVLYLKFDDWLPLRPLFDKYKASDIVLYAYHMLTLIHRKIVNSKEQQLVLLWDNKNVGFSKIFHEVQNWIEVQTLREIVQVMDLNFPETLYKAFFINTARAVVYGFSLVKPFLRPYTLAKILLHDSDESTWMPVVKEFLTDDLIPTELGGQAQLTESIYDFVR